MILLLGRLEKLSNYLQYIYIFCFVGDNEMKHYKKMTKVLLKENNCLKTLLFTECKGWTPPFPTWLCTGPLESMQKPIHR